MTSPAPARHREAWVRGKLDIYFVPVLPAVDEKLRQLAARLPQSRLARPAVLHDLDLLLERRLKLELDAYAAEARRLAESSRSV